jgi:hypothetical protein
VLTGSLHMCVMGSGEARGRRNRQRRVAVIRGGRRARGGAAVAPGFGSLARSKKATTVSTVDPSGRRTGHGGRAAQPRPSMAALGEEEEGEGRGLWH